MEDRAIIDLYWSRNEQAVKETEEKYGAYCRSIAWNILHNRQDTEECVNDTWFRAWNSMPPHRPCILRAFLGKITRNQALKRYEADRAQKRGGGQLPLVLQEMDGCLSDGPELQLEAAELGRALDRFVRTLPRKDCCVFVRRYWFLDPVEDIARRYRMAVGTVKSSLHRSRKKLRQHLEQEGLL